MSTWSQAPTRPSGPADDGGAAPSRAHLLTTVAIPAVVVLAVLGWRLRTSGPSPALAVAALAAAALLTFAALRPGPVRRAMDAIGHAVGGAVAAVLLAIVWLLAVELPGLVGKLLRIDPFDGPERRAGSRWIDRARRDVTPTARWAPEPGLVPVARRTRRRRRIGLGAFVVVTGLLFAAVTYVTTTTRTTPFGILGPATTARSVAPPFPPGTPAAYEGDAWYPQLKADTQWLWTVATAWDPFAMQRIKDVQTKTINVRDGVRRSWAPPACDGCKRLKVWFYGGSAAFGLGQRDQHTIASELARAAWRDGVALDVENRGEPGWLHWQDANRYAWDLATYGAPDAVVFYDGFNEIFGTEGLDDVGDGYAPVDPYAVVYWRTVTDHARAPDAPDGARMLPVPSLDRSLSSSEQAATLIMDRYDRSRKMSVAMSEQAGAPTDWFWQPNRWSRPRVDGEPNTGDFAQWARLDRQLQRRLDPDVHDLSDVLDDVRRPVYWDDVHHDEEAARTIGEAMWQQLKPRYEALAAQR
ncbi:MAG: hypothetical protein U0P45_12975 [Acidimicrobiales bacterium]